MFPPRILIFVKPWFSRNHWISLKPIDFIWNPNNSNEIHQIPYEILVIPCENLIFRGIVRILGGINTMISVEIQWCFAGKSGFCEKSRILTNDANTPKRSYSYLGPTLEKAPTSRKLSFTNDLSRAEIQAWCAGVSGPGINYELKSKAIIMNEFKLKIKS